LFTKHLTLDIFFSASSYYPGRGDTHTFTNDSSRFDLDTSHFDVSDNSDVESERDWLDEPQVTEPARRHPSKMSEAAVIEVRL
jgi:hypothetical protein